MSSLCPLSSLSHRFIYSHWMGKECRLKGNGCRSRKHMAHSKCTYDYCLPDCLFEAEEASRAGRPRPPCKAPGHQYTAESTSSQDAGAAGEQVESGGTASAPAASNLTQPLSGNWAAPPRAWAGQLQEMAVEREREVRQKLETETAHRGVRSTVQFTTWFKVRYTGAFFWSLF